MTVRSSPDVPFFLVGGYSVLGTLTDISHEMEALTEETHALGDSWVEQSYVGVRKASLSQKGFYDDGVGSVHEMLSTGLGVSRVLNYGLEGTATGAAFIGFSGALQVKYTRTAQRAMLHKAEANYLGNGIVDQGKIIRMLNPATATGASTGSPVDWGASSTGGGAGYLQVTALNAIGSATIRLRHSSDNVTYANLGSAFTAVTSGTVPKAQRLAISTGAMERYIAADLTFASASSTAATLTYFVGLARYS